VDIARGMREQFTRELFATTGTQAQPDPVLATMFNALAAQVDRVYQEADQVFFDSALDDLIRGLGMPARLARPAQAVVQFLQIVERELVTPETELIGFQNSGEQVVFTPDASFEVSATELVFAAVYENGKLTTVSGGRTASGTPVLPGNSVPLTLPNAAPMLVVAFRPDAGHLSRLGLFIDVTAPGSAVDRALARSPWQMLDGAGTVVEEGVLRPTLARGGIHQLKFFRPTEDSEEAESAPARALPLSGGSYGSRIWLFPEIPASRRFTSAIPPALSDAVPRLMPDGQDQALDRPLAWVQVPMPAGTRGLTNAISRIVTHCVTASNIDIWNESISFDRMGSVVTHRPMGSIKRHVMGVLGVTGEAGTTYLDAADLEAPPTTGRYRYRGNARFEFSPARHASGRFDTYAMLRLLYCDADGANGIEAGGVRQIRSDLLRNPVARVASLTPSKGGAPPPPYLDARNRFAELLRTRERIVTAADIDVAARAYEPLLREIQVESASEITEAGLGLVTQVTAYASPDDFADPDTEFERLRTELQRYLEQRGMIGNRITVAVRPTRGDR
jgi:hypothetical protein